MFDIRLRKFGDQFRRHCPIHHGTNHREFVVTPQNGLYCRFAGCDGGDGIKLVAQIVAQIQGCELKEAAAFITARSGFGQGSRPPSSREEGRDNPHRRRSTVPPSPNHRSGRHRSEAARSRHPRQSRGTSSDDPRTTRSMLAFGWAPRPSTPRRRSSGLLAPQALRFHPPRNHLCGEERATSGGA